MRIESQTNLRLYYRQIRIGKENIKQKALKNLGLEYLHPDLFKIERNKSSWPINTLSKTQSFVIKEEEQELKVRNYPKYNYIMIFRRNRKIDIRHSIALPRNYFDMNSDSDLNSSKNEVKSEKEQIQYILNNIMKGILLSIIHQNYLKLKI